MKFLLVFLVVLAMGLAADDAQTQLCDANLKFAISLYDKLDEEGKDVLFSPLGIHTLLSMLYQGAEGSTKDALMASLQVSDPAVAAEGYSKILQSLDNVKNVSLYVANKIFVDAGLDLKPDFSDALQTQFSTKIDHLDFSADTKPATAINSWLSEQTHGKIPELFKNSDFTQDSSIALVNAVYFKGDWLHKFDKYNTRSESFNIDGETEIEVQMMHTTLSTKYKNDFVIDARIVELPFSEEGVMMYFILPFDKYELDAVAAKITEHGMERIFTEMKSDEDLHVAIPKFKLEENIDFEQPLKQIGLEILFDKNNCKLSKIGSAEGNLYVSHIKQKVSIELNENGATQDDADSSQSQVYIPRVEEQFYANQPFLIIVRHHNSVIFYGKIVKPISGDSNRAPPGKPSYNEHLASFMRCLDRNKYLAVADIYEGCDLWQ